MLLAMIASYRHRFIFIKTIKTAGTSVEFALGPHCGPHDIVAPLGPGEDIARAVETGVLPRHFAKDGAFEKRYRRNIRKGRTKLLRAQNREAGLTLERFCTDQIITSHACACDVRSWVTPKLWEESLRFTSERHPYEKAVSLAFHDWRGIAGDFADVLDATVRKGIRYPGWPFYTIDDEVAVHRFVRFERLERDLGSLFRELSLPPPVDLPRRRAKARTDRRPASEILSAAQKQIVYDFCAREFELFGWER